VDLPRVQAAVRAVNPYYVVMVSWKQEGDIIKAYPKFPISEAAFNAIKKVFKRFGGKYVSHYGKSWFELVLSREESGSHKNTFDCLSLHRQSSPASASGTALNRLQTQIARLAEAGHELTKEA